MTDAPFVVLARRRAKPGGRDQLLAAIDSLMEQARQADGFISVDVIDVIEDPDQILHYELWSSQEQHDAVVTGDVHGQLDRLAGDVVQELWDPRHFRLLRRYTAASEQAPPRSPDVPPSTTPPAPPPSTETARTAAGGDGSPGSDTPAREALLSPLPTAQMDPATRQTLDALPARLTVFGVLAHAPTALPPVLDLTATLLNDVALHPRLRQLVILHLARMHRSDYEWVQHAALATRVGVTDHQVDAVRRGDIDAGILNADEKLVLRMADDTVRHDRVTEPTFRAALDRFTPREIVELLLVIGWYTAMAQVMRSTNLPVDAPATATLGTRG
jgi:alkylhydroperoxidase family enzyme/quinol monooxygenase YgiN